jgi:hypothetical protein
MGSVGSAVVNTAKSVLQPALDVVAPVVDPLLSILEKPLTAVLPESEEVFRDVRSLLGTGSGGKSPDELILSKLPSSVRNPLEQAVAHVDNLVNTKPGRKQERMLRALELFMEALEAEDL